MKNLADNNLIRFKSITKKKDGIFANFSVTGVKGGAAYRSSIFVDISAAEVDAGNSLEEIIEACAKIAEREVKSSKLQFEGISSI